MKFLNREYEYVYRHITIKFIIHLIKNNIKQYVLVVWRNHLEVIDLAILV
jgi:hypothetical protein